MNLLPNEYIQRKGAQRSNRVCLGLFVIVMVGVLAAAAASYRCQSNTQCVLDRVDEDYQQATAMMSELNQLQQQKQMMLEKARSTSTLLERIPRSYVLAVLTNSLPPNTSLLDVNLYPKRIVTPAAAAAARDAKFASKTGAAATSATQVFSEIIISGLADTDVAVARFIANLARSPLASSVDLVYSQEKTIEIKDSRKVVIDKPLVREFQVRVVLRGDLDVIDVIGKPVAQAPQLETVAMGGRQ
jgi:Tfp pilus assembly protein PilN